MLRPAMESDAYPGKGTMPMKSPIKRIPVVGFSLMLLAGLSACDRNDPTHNVNQTKFPGQVTAGGSTSGEIMARTNRPTTVSNSTGGTPGIPKGSGGTTGGVSTQPAADAMTPSASGKEGERGQSPGGTGVAGTPGIPEGSGGTTSGAEMGGTTPGAAGSQAQSPQQAAPATPAAPAAPPVQNKQ
jgi:hypothetical protein